MLTKETTEPWIKRIMLSSGMRFLSHRYTNLWAPVCTLTKEAGIPDPWHRVGLVLSTLNDPNNDTNTDRLNLLNKPRGLCE